MYSNEISISQSKDVICHSNKIPILSVGGLVVLRINVALKIAVFQPYRDLKAGDNQSLKL